MAGELGNPEFGTERKRKAPGNGSLPPSTAAATLAKPSARTRMVHTFLNANSQTIVVNY
jgi:hypothetical protein